MHNPTKVFTTTINSKQFALYELPGYNNKVISKNKVVSRDMSPQQQQAFMPLVPKLNPRFSSISRNNAFMTVSPDMTQSSMMHEQRNIYSK